MRGLLMIEPLYHQTIRGCKTQTRRSGGLQEVNINPDNWEITGHTGEANQLEEVDFCDFMDTQRNIYCKPRYRLGEVLYLKEPIFKMENNEILYKYDYPVTPSIFKKLGLNRKWSNKLFMPAAAARAFIKITGIRCERLLDISDEDCIAEGIDVWQKNAGHWMIYNAKKDQNPFTVSVQRSFLSLYRFANKVKEVPNLWVWVYEFEYLKDYKQQSI